MYSPFKKQARFHNLKIVVRVATRGNGVSNPASTSYITLYHLAYSEDCSAFQNILDGAGNSKVSFRIIRRPLYTHNLAVLPLSYNIHCEISQIY